MKVTPAAAVFPGAKSKCSILGRKMINAKMTASTIKAVMTQGPISGRLPRMPSTERGANWDSRIDVVMVRA